MPASIRVENEKETGRGWSFDVYVDAGVEGERQLTVELSWVDYEFWTHGRRPPAALVRDLVRHVSEREPIGTLRSRLDASTIRRRHPEVDRLFGSGSAESD